MWTTKLKQHLTLNYSGDFDGGVPALQINILNDVLGSDYSLGACSIDLSDYVHKGRGGKEETFELFDDKKEKKGTVSLLIKYSPQAFQHFQSQLTEVIKDVIPDIQTNLVEEVKHAVAVRDMSRRV